MIGRFFRRRKPHPEPLYPRVAAVAQAEARKRDRRTTGIFSNRELLDLVVSDLRKSGWTNAHIAQRVGVSAFVVAQIVGPTAPTERVQPGKRRSAQATA
jgi:hypothetical protein